MKRPFKIRLVSLDKTDTKYFKVGDIIDVYLYNRGKNGYMYMTLVDGVGEYYFRANQVAKLDEGNKS